MNQFTGPLFSAPANAHPVARHEPRHPRQARVSGSRARCTCRFRFRCRKNLLIPQERQRRGGLAHAREKRPRNGNQFTVNAKN